MDMDNMRKLPRRTGRRILLSVCSLLLMIAPLSGCGALNDATAATAATATASAMESVAPLTYDYAAEDLQTAWDASSAVQIALAGDTATASGEGVSAQEHRVVISKAGTYVLSGNLDGGQIEIDAGKKDFVRLVLNGVNIVGTGTTAIYEKQAGKLVLTLAEGTVNQVSDGAQAATTEDADENADTDIPDAAIYAQDDLTLNGTGSLIVKGNYKDGI
jgi:hypothetical protein